MKKTSILIGSLLFVSVIAISACHRKREKPFYYSPEEIANTNYEGTTVRVMYNASSSTQMFKYVTGSKKQDPATESINLVIPGDRGITEIRPQTISYKDITPVYQSIENRFKIKFDDKTPESEGASAMMATQSSTGFKDAAIYGGNSISSVFLESGVNGQFYPLDQYFELDSMKNIKAFLENNPSIKTEITSSDGHIYYLPYIAETGTFPGRISIMNKKWLEKLLDEPNTVGDSTSINVQYQSLREDTTSRPIVNPRGDVKIAKNMATNPIVLQNQAANLNGGRLTGIEAIRILRKYIDDEYMDQMRIVNGENVPIFSKRSDLFVGKYPAYDGDELFALWRAVKTNPRLLLDNKPNAEVGDIIPYVERVPTDRDGLFRLANMFGIRVFGSDTYSNRTPIVPGSINGIDKYGKLDYSYINPKFAQFLVGLNQLYNEGMFRDDFSDINKTANFRNEGFAVHKNLFMTKDFAPSTMGFEDNPSNNLELVGAFPAVSKYYEPGSGGNTPEDDENLGYIYVEENGRSYKPDGWGISAKATKEEVAASLAIFDFIFSDEGYILQNYGVEKLTWDGFIDPNNPTIQYNRGNRPEPDVAITYPRYTQWTYDSANARGETDVFNFLRKYIGAILPVGYKKSIGQELQTINDNSKGLYNSLKYEESKLIVVDPDNPDYRYQQSRSQLPFDEDMIRELRETRDPLQEYITNNIFRIVREGYGKPGLPRSPEDYINRVERFYNAQEMLELYNQVYLYLRIDNDPDREGR